MPSHSSQRSVRAGCPILSMLFAMTVFGACMAPSLPGQGVEQRATSRATSRPTPLDLRLRLRQLLDCDEPPPRIELDGRIFELEALQHRARELRVVDGEKVELNSNQLAAATVEALVLELLKEQLVSTRHYLSDKAFESAKAAHEREYSGSVFSVELVARQLKGYPSMASYWAWFRLRKSFEGFIASELGKERLAKFLPQVESFLVLDKVKVEAMFFSARRPGSGKGPRWDYERARLQAAAADAALRDGKGFEEVRRLSDDLDRNRAESGLLNFNQLRKHYGASEYAELCSGFSVVDEAFYRTEEGRHTRPMASADGYWILRVQQRRTSGQKITTIDARREQLLRQIYVVDRFRKWAHERLARVLLKEPGKGKVRKKSGR